MENTTQQPQPITVQDLDMLRSIVDLAAQRGAFRGAELETVGTVFNKLNAFLNDIAEKAKAAQEAAQGQAGGTEATTGAETPQGE